MKIVSPDFLLQQAKNLVVEQFATASLPVQTAARIVFDSTVNKFKFGDGTAYRDPTDRTQHTGTQLSSTISDFIARATAITLDQFAAAVAAVSFGSQRIVNVGTPTASTDAATKGYVDGAIQSTSAGISAKGSVLAVATTNVASLSGTTSTVDGVALNTAGMRVLLTAQTTASQNGPWIVQSGAWTRPTTDSNNELETGALWFVEQGATSAASQWWLNSPTAGTTITPGTTSIGIVQFAAAQAYTASTGVTKTGSNFTGVVAPSGGLTVGASGFALDATIVTRKFAQSVGDGTNSTFTITHGLGTIDVTVAVRDAAGNQYLVDNQAASVNTVTLTFNFVPTASQFRVVVQG